MLSSWKVQRRTKDGKQSDLQKRLQLCNRSSDVLNICSVDRNPIRVLLQKGELCGLPVPRKPSLLFGGWWRVDTKVDWKIGDFPVWQYQEKEK